MRRLSGFSLMEMMVVLLIVAIIAAASAPMVNKKMLADTSSGSCPWTLLNDASIAFFANNKTSALIGHNQVPSAASNAKLAIVSNDTPHIAIGNGTSMLKILASNDATGVAITSDSSVNSPSSVAKESVAIGAGSYADAKSVAIGLLAKVTKAMDGNANEGSVAIGLSSKVSGYNGIAIGNQAEGGYNSISIGDNSSSGSYAVAIGPKFKDNNKDIKTRAVANAIAIGAGATTIGTFNNQNYTGQGAIAIGKGVKAIGENSIAIGKICEDEQGNPSGGVHTQATGKFSVALGYQARAEALDAVALGHQSRSAYSKSTAIGYNARTTANQQIVLGDSSTTVYIPGNLIVKKKVELSQDSNDVHIGTITTTGTSPNFMKILRRTGGGYDDLTVSDRRLKNVGKAFVGGLEEIKKLEVFNYTFKKDPAKSPRVGVMAQDLQKIFPNAVFKGDDGFLRIRMEDMFYALVNAVKELAAKFDAQDKKIAELEKQNKELVKTIANLEKRLAKLEKNK